MKDDDELIVNNDDADDVEELLPVDESDEADVPESTRPLLFRLTRRFSFFLFFFLCALEIFFVIGNYQKFLDSNLRYILLVSVSVGIALMIFSIVSMIESVIFLIIERKYGFIVYFFIFLVFLAFSLVSMIFFSTVKVFSDGF